MGKHHSSSPKSVREQIEDSAKDLWSSVMTRDLSSNDNQECQHVPVSLESMIRVMFGPCTTGADLSNEEPSTPQTQEVTPRSSRRKERNSPSPEQQRLEKVPSRPISGKELPGMFPASSPKRRSAVPAAVSNGPPKMIQQTLCDTSNDNTRFDDDGISVITMHTLEEVAEQYGEEGINRIFSDVTQDPIEEIEESWKQTIAPRNATTRSPSTQRTANMSPLRFGRSGQSQGTTHTKRSFEAKSMGTKSTNTTQTNDFVGVWLREEQKYWEDVVKEQEVVHTSPVEDRSNNGSKDIFRKPSHSSSGRSHEQHSKRGGTIATAHSTVFSGPSSNADRSLFATQRDPDGFLDVLIMPAGTELGEI